MLRDSLFDVIDTVYLAARDREAWSMALDKILRMFEVRGVNLMFNDLGRRPDGVMVNCGIDPEVVKLYNTHYVNVDPVIDVSVHSRPGAIFDSEELFSSSWWRRTELYGDLMESFGLEHISGTTLLAEADAYAALSLLRGPGTPALHGESRAAFHHLVRHVRNAIEVHRRLCMAERQSQLLEEVVEHLGCGVVVADEAGSVLFANDAAVRMAHRQDGFGVSRAGVRGADPSTTAKLRALLVAAAETGAGRRFDGGGTMRLGRPSGLPAFQVLVVPLPSRSLPGEPGAAAVFITEPGASNPPSEQLLGRLFGFTPAESRLAVALMEDLTPEAAAERFAVSVSTIRTHLRALFSKTDTKRQSELMMFLMRSPLGWVDQGNSGPPAQ